MHSLLEILFEALYKNIYYEIFFNLAICLWDEEEPPGGEKRPTDLESTTILVIDLLSSNVSLLTTNEAHVASHIRPING